MYKADSAMSLTGTGTRTSFPVASATSGEVARATGTLTDLLAWLQRPRRHHPQHDTRSSLDAEYELSR